MGWFWADPQIRHPPIASIPHPHIRAADGDQSPPPGCPMHKRSVDALNPQARPSQPACDATSSKPSGCPVPHGNMASAGAADASAHGVHQSSPSAFSKLNPLNYMFGDLSQRRAPGQTYDLPTTREPSTIPRGSGDGNWEYPSPQQMYHALLRKGYEDTDVTAVESMVSVHNFLNEGAWGEILEWEKRFSGGLAKGWRICRKGEANVDQLALEVQKEEAQRLGGKEPEEYQPSLVRFQGRPKDMTPKAAMIQLLGRVYPSMFATEPPFDRHDWYVSRPSPSSPSETTEVRYVIDYYSGPPEPTGEPVFYLDVRPAFTPTGAAERMLRWGCDLWWRAAGGDVREAAARERLERERAAAR